MSNFYDKIRKYQHKLARATNSRDATFYRQKIQQYEGMVGGGRTRGAARAAAADLRLKDPKDISSDNRYRTHDTKMAEASAKLTTLATKIDALSFEHLEGTQLIIQLKRRINELITERKELQQLVDTGGNDNAALIADANTRIGQANARIETLLAKLQAATTTHDPFILKVGNRIARAETHLEALRDALATVSAGDETEYPITKTENKAVETFFAALMPGESKEGETTVAEENELNVPQIDIVRLLLSIPKATELDSVRNILKNYEPYKTLDGDITRLKGEVVAAQNSVNDSPTAAAVAGLQSTLRTTHANLRVEERKIQDIIQRTIENHSAAISGEMKDGPLEEMKGTLSNEAIGRLMNNGLIHGDLDKIMNMWADYLERQHTTGVTYTVIKDGDVTNDKLREVMSTLIKTIVEKWETNYYGSLTFDNIDDDKLKITAPAPAVPVEPVPPAVGALGTAVVASALDQPPSTAAVPVAAPVPAPPVATPAPPSTTGAASAAAPAVATPPRTPATAPATDSTNPDNEQGGGYRKGSRSNRRRLQVVALPEDLDITETEVQW